MSMSLSLWVVIITASLLVVVQPLTWFQITKLRRSGHYPERGKATMADVERLVRMGSRVLAMRCYREIHGCSLRQAKEAVDALQIKH